MCILPNLGPHDLSERKQTRNVRKKAESIKIIVTEQLLENKV